MPVVLKDDAIKALRDQVAPVIKLSEQETRQLLRPMTGFVEVRCANCQGGHQGYQLAWSIEDPHHARCQYCGHVYPSAKYPMDKIKVVVSPKGERQEYPYYEGPDKYPHYFQAKIDYETQHYFAGAAYQLAQLYAATGDKQYARRAAVLLHRLAEIYPSFSVHGISNYSFRTPTFHPFYPPVPYRGESRSFGEKTLYPYLSGRWGAVWLYHEIDHRCLCAYDLLCPSGEFEKLSAEVGRDVRKQIEDDLLRGMVDFTLTFPRYLSNMTPNLSWALILAGKTLGTPDYVHIGVKMMQDLLSQQFFADGMWHESAVSYHQQTIVNLRDALALAEGQTDPPGYTFEEDGARYDDLKMLRDLPFVEKATRAVDGLSYPDGTHLCVHDTWFDTSTRFRDDSGSTLLWAMGQAMLRSGQGRDQVVLGLHFSGSHGHAHADKLDLTLFARGHELIPDIGYTHTSYRPFSTSTAAHNTVVVDESDCSLGANNIPWDGRIEVFEPDGKPARVVSVNCPQAYGKTTAVYQRTCALVEVPGGGHYVLDMFQVVGGKCHDYLLKGDPRAEQTIISSMPLEKRDYTFLGPSLSYKPYANEGGSVAVEGKYNVYGLLRDLASANTKEPWVATFRGQDGVGLQATIMADGEAEVCTMSYPTIRQAKEDNRKLEDFRAKMLAVRRKGEALASTFVGVLEPFGPESPGLKASALRVDGKLVGAKVEGRGFSDLIVFLREKPAQPVAVSDQVTTDARFTLVRKQGEKSTAQVLEGRAVVGGFAVETGAAITGKVLAVARQDKALVVEAKAVPANMAGRNLIVDHADGATSLFQIVEAKLDVKGTRLLLTEAPDFELTERGTKFLFYPVREIAGTPTFRILPRE